MAKVSILMSCYNSERWLCAAIESILGQSFTDFEFVIVDDGSTDSTPSIVADYQRRDSRIRVIRKANTGLADSLNVGIEQASGEWVARIDADDVALSNRLEKQLQIASNSDFVYVGSGAIEIDDTGRRTGEYIYPVTHEDLLDSLKRGKSFPAHSSALINTKALRRVGSYRTRIRRSQDWDLWLRLSEVGRLTSVQESLVMIRKHAMQVSHESGGKDQIVFSRAAIASYFLRQLGVSDPVDLPDVIFHNFIDWVDRKLAREGVYELYKLRTLLQRVRSESPFGIESLLAVLLILSKNPLIASKLLLHRHFGEDVGLQLAREWISESDSIKKAD